MKYIRRHYTEEFKRKVVEDYLTSDLTYVEIVKKYDIAQPCIFYRWKKKFESGKRSDSVLNNPNLEVMGSSKKEKSKEDLQKENERLKKALSEADFKVIAYKKLLENTQKEFGKKVPKK